MVGLGGRQVLATSTSDDAPPVIHIAFNRSPDGMRAALSGQGTWFVDATGENVGRMMFARNVVFIDAPVTLEQTVNRLRALCHRIGRPGRVLIDCADKVANEYGALRLSDFLRKASQIANDSDYDLEVVMHDTAPELVKVVKRAIKAGRS